MVILEARNVVKTYKKNGEIITVLNNINFSVDEGNFVFIVGPRGQGKTTLINVLSGLDKPDSGLVIFENETLTDKDEEYLAKIRNEKMGLIFQDVHLISSFTAVENVEAPLYPSEFSEKEIREKSLQLLEKLGLKYRVEHFPEELSDGERRAVAIARALINEPKIVFADEPTAGLDEEWEKKVIDLLRAYNSEKKATIIFITAKNTLVKKYGKSGDKIFEIKGGKLKTRGS